MRTCYLIHGFNVGDAGKGTTDLLRPELEGMGLKVMEVDYGWFGLLRVRLCNEAVARTLASLAEPDSVAVGHSNGCAIAHRAAQYGAPFGRMFYINPALDRDAELAEQVDRLTVFYSESDSAVKASRWRPWSRWGDMGAVGYQGPADSRIVSVDEEQLVNESGRWTFHVEHSDMLKKSLFRQSLTDYIQLDLLD